MTAPDPAAPPLANVSVVLDHPQDLVNVAVAVRSMKNMGLTDLRLVEPADWDPERITGIAHRTDELVEAARHYDQLGDAIAHATFVVGTSARGRSAKRNYVRPRRVAHDLATRAVSDPVAVVFGREDRGLSNRALDLCHAVAVIPTDPGHPSLNLAQAVLVMAYEVFLAVGGGDQELPEAKRGETPATREEIEEMFAALRGGLERIEFFKSRAPRQVMRTIRTLLSRAEPDRREARLMRAVGFEIGHYIDRRLGD